MLISLIRINKYYFIICNNQKNRKIYNLFYKTQLIQNHIIKFIYLYIY
jgi:hypothetical protein